MSENIHKSHNVSKLMYHFVLPTKYRRVVVSDEVENVIKETCIEISKRYDIYFFYIKYIENMKRKGGQWRRIIRHTDKKRKERSYEDET